MKLSKTIFVVTASFLSLMNAADTDMPSIDNSSMNQGHDLNANQMITGINAFNGIDILRDWDVFTTVKFNYWQAQEDWLELADRRPVNANNSAGDKIRLGFDFKPGFTVGAGVKTPYDGWELYTDYTYLHSENSVSEKALSTSFGLVGIWKNSETTNFTLATGADGHWRLNTHIWDVHAARNFLIGEKLSLRGHYGFRTFFLPQHYRTVFHFATGWNPQTRAKQQTWGFGLRTGIDLNYLLWYGIRFNGGASLTTAYQKFRLDLQDQQDLNPQQLHQHFKTSFSMITPNPDLYLGLAWGMYFNQRKVHVDLAASYLFSMFFSQNQMFDLLNQVEPEGHWGFNGQNSGAGDLYYQGLSIALRCDF